MTYEQGKGQVHIISGIRFVEIVSKGGKLINEGKIAKLAANEIYSITKEQIDNICYFFGGKWYKQEINHQSFIDDETMMELELKFEERLKYVGQYEDDFSFCHLGVHSGYELLNGSGEAKHWAEKARFLGHLGLGICDKNTLGGVLAHQIACKKNGIKSIIGETIDVLYVVNDTQYVAEARFYVKNQAGWKNLLNINKLKNVDYLHEPVPQEKINKYSKGLVFVFTHNSLLRKLEDYSEIQIVIDQHEEIYESVYVQIDSVEYKNDDIDISLLNYYKRLKKWDIKLKWILINDSYYIDKDNKKVKYNLNRISGTQDQGRSDDQYYKTANESLEKLLQLFKDEDEGLEILTQAFNSTLEVMDDCDFMIDTGEHKLPKFKAVTMYECQHVKSVYKKKCKEFCKRYDLEDIEDNETLFWNLLEEGMAKKVPEGLEQEYAKRIETEARVIVNAGFVDYFLILWDACRYSRENNIMVGVGRGSVGGSLLAYFLDIINIDPIKHDLLFERFLNEARVTPEVFYDVTLENGKKARIPKKAFENLNIKEGSDVKESDIQDYLLKE